MVSVNIRDLSNHISVEAAVDDSRMMGLPRNPASEIFEWGFYLDQPLAQPSMQAIGKVRASVLRMIQEQLKGQVYSATYYGSGILVLMLRRDGNRQDVADALIGILGEALQSPIDPVIRFTDFS